MSGRTRALMVVVCALVALTAMAPRIPQPADYHQMADQRSCVGLPNCLNVISNAAFIPVGVAGLYLTLAGGSRATRDRWVRWSYAAFFGGTLLTAVGSTYYHLAPDNQRLVWDRLPIVLSLAGLTTAILAERVNHAAGWLLVPLLFAAALSVLWWRWTELSGAGDLRPYVAMQFGALITIAFVLAMYPSPDRHGAWLFVGLLMYGLAKVFELTDGPTLHVLHGIVSGHTLKHGFAAAGVGCVTGMLRARSR